MPNPPLPARAVEMLRRPNPCVMAVVRPDGAPVSTATWYLWEDDGRVLINLDEGRVRLKHLRADPRVTLTVFDGTNWYSHLGLLGRVTEFRDDEDLSDIDRISAHYGGSAYPDRDRGRVSVWIEVERWFGWGEIKDAVTQSG
ncbi:PPOX class F420-dependent oxidoreductase [Streptomyces sp. SHP 1-2]|uniref:PPOX class F420-dependent oxidoreductase n=1 Tax=Streptomyces sp. SHP 1-2 TaxID=2769489 RepID=UPI002238A184|nr:PPOX class F420-dependent oxidoreductase [Streptomyces sp. SHP 1-2]MCW5250282.1 PPOX class F420-dependent oxidoreductase [Streptomyces sp. SHP 1-2]